MVIKDIFKTIQIDWIRFLGSIDLKKRSSGYLNIKDVFEFRFRKFLIRGNTVLSKK